MIIVVIYIIEYITEKPIGIICQFFSQVFLSEVLNTHIKKKNMQKKKKKSMIRSQKLWFDLFCFFGGGEGDLYFFFLFVIQF